MSPKRAKSFIKYVERRKGLALTKNEQELYNQLKKLQRMKS